MSIEIERKFLVTNNTFILNSHKKQFIKQGFLNSNKDRTVRIRVLDHQGYITVKGISNKSGTTRFEWEKEISVQEAESLLLLTEQEPIEKFRYLVKNNNLVFEVDIFEGSNKGLIIAEIELSNENQKFNKPEWIGAEVTGDIKYYNSSLSTLPFSKWSKNN
ncbi:CYTH domain-containing protein [Flavicella sp.]|uniref:CYTH domain-containing protein n=1 Tax=Flavicella sp. TaxID=2957742 RepID=UPI003015BC76